MAKKFDLNDDSVAVVIGSGAGGGTLSNELAQKGVKVVCLEAGKNYSPDDFINDEWSAFLQTAWLDNRSTSGSWSIATNWPNLPSWIVKSVGGSTLHWAGASLRFQEHEFKVRTEYGDVAGANLLDWPIDLKEMEPYYDKAEYKIGVTRTHGIPGLPGNNNFKVFYDGAKKLGYKDVHTGRMGINSMPRDGRNACLQLGFCFQGCKSGAKWSAGYSEIPKAEQTGNFELRTQAHVIQITHNKSGKVDGVVYVDKDGNQQKQKARIVAVAGNSIETPRLLLMSNSSMYPDGLSNSSGQVGKNFMRHMTGTVYGTMPGEVHFDRGTQMAGIVMDESGHDDSRGFAGGYYMQTLPGFGLGAIAGNIGNMSVDSPGKWGRNYTREVVENYKNMAGMWLVGEDMPRSTNRITLSSTEKDQYGLPAPNVHFDDHPNDVAMREYAYKKAEDLYNSVGAVQTYRTPPYPSTHNLGTNRMSANAKDGVVNKWGRSHDIKNLFVADGSVMTTGAAANPTLTITALAIRTGEYLASELKKNNI